MAPVPLVARTQDWAGVCVGAGGHDAELADPAVPEGPEGAADLARPGLGPDHGPRPVDKAAEFLTKKKSTGQYFSVAEISEELTAARVMESERSMITSHVNPNQGAVGSLQEIEAQATTYARQNRGKETPNLYAESGTTKLTKERAYALMLEEHPEVYGAFVAQHNAKGLIATLERAGVRLAR